MTLIEAVAAVALVGSLLVAALLARAQLKHRWAEGHRRILAIETADALATGWSLTDTWPGDGEHGEVSDSPFVWRSTVIDDEPIKGLDARTLRIEIVDAKAATASGRVLSTLEVLVPHESDQSVTEQAIGAAKGPRYRHVSRFAGIVKQEGGDL